MERYINVEGIKEATTLRALLDRVRELEDLNNIMAHNLRGAAANIRMMTELLQGANLFAAPEPPSEEISCREALHYISASAEALTSTLDIMVEEVNRKLNEQAEFVDCDINEIVDNVVGQLSGFMVQKKTHIALHLAVRHIRYARVYLESLFYNLVSNAVKYAKPGRPLEIDIRTYLHRGRPAISVRDNGQGMDMSLVREKLFQLNETFNKKLSGKGIGLYITKKHIEELGGSIDVQSRVDEGTKFIVKL